MKKFLLILLLLAYGCEESSTNKETLSPEGVAQSIGSPREKRLTFFDVNEYGHERPIVNFIDTGDMQGMVQFAQTHTTYPNGNQDRNLPDLVPFKDALVLFTPANASLKSLRIEVKDNKTGQSKSINMNHPLFMPLSDYNNKSGKKDITYSKRSWSANIPADFVTPNMQITFIGTYADNSEHTGVLNSTSIDFASPVEGYLFFVKLGMLTNYPSEYPFDFTMLDDPERALQEYLQTVPFSKYVAAAYEPRKLDAVILRDGTIYELSGERGFRESQYDKPEAHYGDMREDVGKAQISVGIDNANKGVASSALDQNHVYGNDIFYMAVHHAQGLYKGGKIQGHGLSGGNGIGTLFASSGNEFSHEVGHAYGMGHYPHGEASDGSVHGFNTGWGYDAYKFRMRANVNWNPPADAALPFYNTYSWNHDSMAGGWADSAISRYTHNTAWSTRDIQKNMGSKYVLGKKGTGYAYYKWDKDLKDYVEVTEAVDKGFTERRKAPTKVGVPVITILGGYDPTDTSSDGRKAVLYPYFRGNYGNTFDNLFVKAKPSSNCYLEITYYGNKPTEYVELSKDRYKKDLINKFHVNIEESKKPKTISLYVNGKKYKTNTTTILESVYSKPMKSAVIIGKDKDKTYGYDVLNEMYVERLNKEFKLVSLTGAPLSPEQKELVEILDRQGWISKLNAEAQSVANEYLKEYKSIREVDLYLDNNYGALENRDGNAIAGLKSLLSTSGLGTVENLFATAGILGKCIEVYNNGKTDKAIKVTDCIPDSNNQKWVQDSAGRIHSAAAPGYCLDSNNLGYLVECSSSPTQTWSALSKSGKYQYQSKAGNTNKCIDYNQNNGTLTLWDCKSTPANQGFDAKIPEDKNKYLSSMKGSLIDELYKYARP